MALKKIKKCKSVTPITLAVPKILQDKIKKIPRDCLEKFLENANTINTPTYWYTITFRIKAGLNIANLVYTDEAVIAMQELMDICFNIKDRFIITKKWDITKDEAHALLIGFDAIDEMTDQTTRRIQLDAFNDCDQYMKKILKEFNKAAHLFIEN